MAITVKVAGRDHTVIAVRNQSELPPVTASAPVCVDIETNGLPIYDRDFQVRTVQVSSPAWEAGAYVIPARIENYPRLADIFEAAPVVLSHHAMVEWQGMARAGIIPGPHLYWPKTLDTMLMVAVVSHPHGPTGDARLGLKDNTRALVDADYDLDRQLKATMKAGYREDTGEVYKSGPNKGQPKTHKVPYTWGSIPIDSPEYTEYAAADVIAPPMLFDALSAASYAKASEHYKMARDLSLLMQRRIVRGLEVDEGNLLAAEADNAAQVVKPNQTLRANGIDPTRGATADTKAILIEALEDAGITVPVSKKTKGPSLAQAAVRLSADGKFLPAVLEAWYAKEQANKFKSAYLDTFRHGLEEGSGLVHPDIRIMQAATGRTSVATPPLQQLPTEGTTRGCLRASLGKVLVTADLSQIEFRVAGALSGDKALLDMVLGGTKIHNVVAKLAFGPGFSDKQYGASKTAVYAWLFGATPATIAKQTGVSMKTAKTLIRTIEDLFPVLCDFKKQRMSLDRAVTWYGREIQLDPSRPWSKLNYEVQGSAYDLFTLGGLRAADALGHDSIWLMVHDEVICEVDEADADEAAWMLGEALSTEFMGVPCPAVGKVLGRNWSK